MKTVERVVGLTSGVATSGSEIERLRRFQTNRYFESGLVDQLPTTLPADPLVECSTYLGVYANGNVVATARMITDGERLPLLNHHDLFPEYRERLERDRVHVAELSRLAIAPDVELFSALSMLCREFLRFGLRNDSASLLVAGVSPPLARLVKQVLNIPRHMVGPKMQGYLGFPGKTVPMMIDTVEFMRELSLGNVGREEFWSEGLVLDLTDTNSRIAS